METLPVAVLVTDFGATLASQAIRFLLRVQGRLMKMGVR